MADRNRNPQQALFNPRQGWPLGNRSAAGEFVQRGVKTESNSAYALALNYYHSMTLTYPVAFNVTPIVVALGGTPTSVYLPETTTCTLSHWDNTNGASSTTQYWVAIGS